MAKIAKLQKTGATIYPATIPQAVIDGNGAQLNEVTDLSLGRKISISKKRYIRFDTKLNDVIQINVSNVNVGANSGAFSISATEDATTTNFQVIALNQNSNGVYSIVSNGERLFLYFNTSQTDMSFDLSIKKVSFSEIKAWVLGENYLISNMTFNSNGTLKNSAIQYPNGVDGYISSITYNGAGDIIRIVYVYGVPTLLTLQMDIAYVGNSINTTITKI